MLYRLACTKCGHLESDRAFRCSRCGSILEVKIDYSSIKIGRDFRKERIRNSKYLKFFPINGFAVDSDEGGTTLVKKRVGQGQVFLKLETRNPTGSFKDRGSSVEIAKAVELKMKSVCCASTGNMGISVSRYARKAGISATIFIGRGASRGKMAKIRGYGAHLVRVSGDFNTALNAAEAFARKTGAFICGDYHFRKEGRTCPIAQPQALETCLSIQISCTH